jgi:hypothetical protein
MVDKNLGRRGSKAGLQAVSLETPHMTKSERLHRWADNLELRKKLELINLPRTVRATSSRPVQKARP